MHKKMEFLLNFRRSGASAFARTKPVWDEETSVVLGVGGLCLRGRTRLRVRQSRVEFAFNRNLTRRHGKADGPAAFFGGERRKGFPMTARLDFSRRIRLRPRQRVSPPSRQLPPPQPGKSCTKPSRFARLSSEKFQSLCFYKVEFSKWA